MSQENAELLFEAGSERWLNQGEWDAMGPCMADLGHLRVLRRGATPPDDAARLHHGLTSRAAP